MKISQELQELPPLINPIMSSNVKRGVEIFHDE